MQLSLDFGIDRPPIPGSESADIFEIADGVFLYFDGEDRAIAVEAKHGTAIDTVKSLVIESIDAPVEIGRAIDTGDGYVFYSLLHGVKTT